MLASHGGRDLLSHHQQTVAVVVPKQMPRWAIHLLPQSARRYREAIWATVPQEWIHSGISGVHTVSLRQWVPKFPVSQTLLQTMARSVRQWGHAQAMPANGKWAVSLHGLRKTTVRMRLMQTLEPAMAPDSSIVVINAQGQVLSVQANPVGRKLAWQPRPIGTTLSPLMMAQASSHPSLFKGLTATSGTDVMTQVASRWGGTSIQHAFERLGITSGDVLVGQPVNDPALPSPSPRLMTGAVTVWATPLQVARAYLPFVAHGQIPQLTAVVRHTHTSHRRYRVISPTILAEVAGHLPLTVINGVRFRVWRPNGSYAVAFTQQDGGLVVVGDNPGPQWLNVLQDMSHWIHP